jgi:uncharacterized protein (DUF1800 family)
LDLDFQPDDEFLEAFDAMGQPLFGRVTPDGYPDTAEAWQHTSSVAFRWKLVQHLLAKTSLLGPKHPSDWSRRLLGRSAKGLGQLSHLGRRELVALLAMSPDFQMR